MRQQAFPSKTRVRARHAAACFVEMVAKSSLMENRKEFAKPGSARRQLPPCMPKVRS
jgi:hypothetical protein